MSNNKQSSVEWLSNQIYELFEQYSEGNFDRITLNKLVLEATNKAKEMEKGQIKEAWTHGFDWGMMEQSLAEQGKPSTLIDANHFYNETYGDNK
jgi:hypothetical protein